MSSRLPETDLANWAFQPAFKKRESLERFILPKKIKGTYEPFRFVFGDVVNKQLPLLGEQEPTPWNVIESEIQRLCRSTPDSLQMNLDIARATHTFIEQNNVAALPVDITSLVFGTGHLYQFGLPLLLRYPDRTVAVFLDLRRTNYLSIEGRNFVFSAMHERFRTAYPDLAEIGLQVFRYRNDKARTVVPIDVATPRYSLDELASDVRETYEIYHSLLRGDEDRKRRSGGAFGPLL
jgi:hypothetical protein